MFIKKKRRYWKIRLTSSKVQGINMYRSGVLTNGHNILHIWQSWLLALPSFSIHASITEDERTRAFSKEQINSIWGEGKAGSHIRLFFLQQWFILSKASLLPLIWTLSLSAPLESILNPCIIWLARWNSSQFSKQLQMLLDNLNLCSWDQKEVTHPMFKSRSGCKE